MKTTRHVILGLLASLTLALWSAAPAQAGSRSIKRLGIYGSIAGDPSPSLMGINLGYNLADFLQVHGGYGITAVGVVNGTTLGGGAKLFVPDWNLSPTVGLTYSQFKGDLLGLLAFDAVSVTTLQVGLDWQTGYGLYLGVGATKLLSPSSSSSGMIPYVQLGWFF